MGKLVGICVSGRIESKNRALLDHVSANLPDGWGFHWIDRLDELPLFATPSPEPEPEPVLNVREVLSNADAILITTPEYIHSLPAALKNLFEWTVASGEFYQKPVAVWTANPLSPHVVDQVTHILETMTATVVRDASGCPRPDQVVDWLKTLLEAAQTV